MTRIWDAIDAEAERQGNAIRVARQIQPKRFAAGRKTAKARMNDRRCVAYSETNCNRLGGRTSQW